MTVITITREVGAPGEEIAESVAEALGLEFIDQERVEHDLADRTHVSEHTVHRYIEGGATLFDHWQMNRKDFAVRAAQEVYELAMEGTAVICGWFAPQLLEPVSHVLSVRICAPFETRVRNLIERGDGRSEATVARRLKTNDAAHARTVRRLYHIDWLDPLLYDVVLNSGQLSVEECARTVSRLAQEESFQETGESRAALAELSRIVRLRDRGNGSGAPSAPGDPHHFTGHRARAYERPSSREDRDLLP